MDLSVEEKLFFGTRNIFFKSVSGNVRIYHQEEWTQCVAQEEIQRQFHPLKIEGIDLPVVIPGIPALNFIPARKNQEQLQRDQEDPLPEIFAAPLIKCSSGDPSIVISGVASGVRSGLIKIGDVWYRLKGCGNHDQGFLLRKRIHPQSSTARGAGNNQSADWCDIRGCAFIDTTLRELHYTKVLSKLLPSFAISANSSLGFMEYSDPEYLPCGPSVQTTCILETTIGDRRFGTHVLAGIELLLPFLIPEDIISTDSLLQLFPIDRPDREANDLSRLIQTGPFISDFTLGTSQCGHDRETKGLCWPHLSRDHTTLANLLTSSCAIPLRLPCAASASANRTYPLQWSNDRGPQEMSAEWKLIWDSIVEKLSKILSRIEQRNPSPSSLLPSDPNPSTSSSAGEEVFLTQVLSYLYSRCGYDCGLILSAMHSQRISWGTYQDSMCRRDFDEWHCNAHVNNLVIIPPEISRSSSSHSFLSFLDVDMAYGEEEMIQLPTGDEGERSERSEGVGVFDHILWREYVNMMEVLAGNDSSTGVPNAALGITESYSPVLKGIQSALYDTMILAYQEGYSQIKGGGGEAREMAGGERIKGKAVMEYDEDLHEAAYYVIQLAIIVMVDYLA
jgi:hypothetical protein